MRLGRCGNAARRLSGCVTGRRVFAAAPTPGPLLGRHDVRGSARGGPAGARPWPQCDVTAPRICARSARVAWRAAWAGSRGWPARRASWWRGCSGSGTGSRCCPWGHVQVCDDNVRTLTQNQLEQSVAVLGLADGLNVVGAGVPHHVLRRPRKPVRSTDGACGPDGAGDDGAPPSRSERRHAQRMCTSRSCAPATVCRPWVRVRRPRRNVTC